MNELQSLRYNASYREFKDYVGKVVGMPVIRVQKKQERKLDTDLTGDTSGFKRGVGID